MKKAHKLCNKMVSTYVDIVISKFASKKHVVSNIIIRCLLASHYTFLLDYHHEVEIFFFRIFSNYLIAFQYDHTRLDFISSIQYAYIRIGPYRKEFNASSCIALFFRKKSCFILLK